MQACRREKSIVTPAQMCYNVRRQLGARARPQREKKGGPAVDVRPGDRLQMKKPHPCGSKEFLVLRAGMDFKIRCCGCGREVMVPRLKCEKNIKKILRENGEPSA